MIESIIVKQVTKSFKTVGGLRPVIKDLNLTILEGESLGIIGRSGSGKSTLLALIGGILTPDSGKIIIDGTEISNLNEKDRKKYRKKKISFVFQFNTLIPDLTISENIQRPLMYGGQNYKESYQKAISAIEEVSLGKKIHQFPNDLSGGEKLRASIAQVLSRNPSLILADEPTGRLGDAYAYEMIQLLTLYSSQNNITMICVTHRYDFQKFFDHIYKLEDGYLKTIET